MPEPTQGEDIQRGSAAYDRDEWAQATAHLAAADAKRALEPADLERLALAAFLAGQEGASEAAWARAHQSFLQRGDRESAAGAAFWLAFMLLGRGEAAPAGGWIARAERILEGVDDCVQRGYLLLPRAVLSVYEGAYTRAYEVFEEAARVGEQFQVPELAAFARHGQGRALLRMGRRGEGVALLDEAMAAVEAGDVSPALAGDIYCSVIEACHEIFDLRRAAEWTDALTRWCERQPELVPYRGHCLVRRAEILQLRGNWSEAAAEASRACDWLLRPPPRRAVGMALYQRGEIHRLRGQFDDAETAYREASEWGRPPEPGLPLLRLAQGQVEAAKAGIRLALEATQDRGRRCRFLPAAVDIALASGDIHLARSSAAELSGIARESQAPLLNALAAHAEAAVLLAEEDPRSALPVLQRSAEFWMELDVPYEGARVRSLIAAACRQMGDHDRAELELSAARAVFLRLGAAPDLQRVERLAASTGEKSVSPLTRRELQVLRQLAAGDTNRAIAARLHLSERTVERHVSNIFMKLGLSSRSAATAYAYQKRLV